MVKRVGDAVFGSSMNQQGVLHVTARRIGKDTAISQVRGSSAPDFTS